MDRKDIEEIAKLAAQETLIRARRYTESYYPPETVAIGLSQSKSEEFTACDWYSRRAKDAIVKGDIKTAELYKHLIKEEAEHFLELNQRLKEIVPVMMLASDDEEFPGMAEIHQRWADMKLKWDQLSRDDKENLFIRNGIGIGPYVFSTWDELPSNLKVIASLDDRYGVPPVARPRKGYLAHNPPSQIVEDGNTWVFQMSVPTRKDVDQKVQDMKDSQKQVKIIPYEFGYGVYELDQSPKV